MLLGLDDEPADLGEQDGLLVSVLIVPKAAHDLLLDEVDLQVLLLGYEGDPEEREKRAHEHTDQRRHVLGYCDPELELEP